MKRHRHRRERGGARGGPVATSNDDDDEDEDEGYRRLAESRESVYKNLGDIRICCFR